MKDDEVNPQFRADALEERLIDFAVRVVRLSAALPKTAAGKHIAGQIMRFGTSAAQIMARHGEQRAKQTSSTNLQLFLRN